MYSSRTDFPTCEYESSTLHYSNNKLWTENKDKRPSINAPTRKRDTLVLGLLRPINKKWKGICTCKTHAPHAV